MAIGGEHSPDGVLLHDSRDGSWPPPLHLPPPALPPFPAARALTTTTPSSPPPQGADPQGGDNLLGDPLEEASAQRVAAVASERDEVKQQVLQLRKDRLLERAFSQAEGAAGRLLPPGDRQGGQGRARTPRCSGAGGGGEPAGAAGGSGGASAVPIGRRRQAPGPSPGGPSEPALAPPTLGAAPHGAGRRLDAEGSGAAGRGTGHGAAGPAAGTAGVAEGTEGSEPPKRLGAVGGL